MKLLSFNRRLHHALKRLAPDGYQVHVERREGTLFTVIYCDDLSYFAPWAGLQSVLEDFGY